MGTVIAMPLWSPPEDALPLKRGERNNNPGNIDYDAHIDWVGLLGIEIVPKADRQKFNPRFCRFDTPEHGIRAVAKCLRTYVERDGCKTVRDIIGRWAPPEENDTAAYVAHVANECGVHPDEPITPDPTDYAELTRAIVLHEQGRVIYPDVMIADAVGLALAS